MIEEAQSAPGNYRTSLLSQSRGYKNELEKLKRELVGFFVTLYFVIHLFLVTHTLV